MGAGFSIDPRSVHVGVAGDTTILIGKAACRLLSLDVVGGAPRGRFDELLTRMIGEEVVANEAELDSEALERLTEQFLDLADRLGAKPPEDPLDQIAEAARAVYKSWESARAREYRRLKGLSN